MTDALIGVFIGATVTLAGSAVQLWFSAKQRERDRHMQLRRDIYLQAAEGLAAYIDYLSQHGRTDIPFGKATAPPGAMGWLLKTYLVADTKTLISFNEANAAIAGAIIDLAAHRLAVQQVDDDITVQRSAIEQTQRFLESMVNEIQTADLDTPTEWTLQRVEWATQQRGIATASVQEQIQKLSALTDEHARRTKSLVERSIRIIRDAQKPIRMALLAARSELEVRLDAKQFASATADIDRRMSDKIQELLGLIEVTSEDGSSRK